MFQAVPRQHTCTQAGMHIDRGVIKTIQQNIQFIIQLDHHRMGSNKTFSRADNSPVCPIFPYKIY